MKRRHVLRLVGLVIAAILVGGAAGAVVGLGRDLPQIRELENFRPSAVSRIYSSDGVVLAELFAQRRDPVSIHQMPDVLLTALITTEDRQFYRHNGVDLRGVARAVVNNIRSGRYAEGASTLTQQLSKTLFLTPEKSLRRKIREAILAFQLERRYTKDEILELYLNQVYFGSGAYGVEMAARRYFDKSIRDVTLDEAAMIAAMPRAPSVYSPLVNPDTAVRRRNIVLMQMRDTGAISDAEYQAATAVSYSRPSGGQSGRKAPYFIDYIIRDLEETVGSTALYKGGLTVHTTLDYTLQQAAEAALEDGLERIAERMAARKQDGSPAQGAIVAIDVESGAILAMAGGRRYAESPFNRAVDARRQPGSAFKPIVYALAVEQGFSQAALVLDAPVSYDGWEPKNFDGSYQGEITLRKALADSRNIPAARLLQAAGPSAAIDFARACGITSPLSPYPALALGAFEISLLEMTSAYTVFANQGIHARPYGVESVTGRGGRMEWVHRSGKNLAMSREGAAVITDMLRAAVNEGTGRAARAVGRPVAGKTGTTSAFRDALFVGFSPTIAAGVWTGRDDAVPMGPFETGSRAALPIWVQFMTDATNGPPPAFFDQPEGVVEIRIDPVTGARTTGSGGVSALFRNDKTPEQKRAGIQY